MTQDLMLKIKNILEEKGNKFAQEYPNFKEDSHTARANHSVWIYDAIEKGELDTELRKIGYVSINNIPAKIPGDPDISLWHLLERALTAKYEMDTGKSIDDDINKKAEIHYQATKEYFESRKLKQ